MSKTRIVTKIKLNKDKELNQQKYDHKVSHV